MKNSSSGSLLDLSMSSPRVMPGENASGLSGDFNPTFLRGEGVVSATFLGGGVG